MTNKEAIKEAEVQIDMYKNMILYNKDFEPKNDNSNYEHKIEFFRLAIEALEKADKYKWHDLKENPDDLPEANRWGESNYVLVKALIKVECFACNDMRKAYYSHTQKKWSIDGHVFAWRYIEPFKDEECVFWMNDNI